MRPGCGPGLSLAVRVTVTVTRARTRAGPAGQNAAAAIMVTMAAGSQALTGLSDSELPGPGESAVDSEAA